MSARRATVMWFRRDLRADANAAVAAAGADSEVVPLFVIDPAFARAGTPRRAFMIDALRELDAATGNGLVFRVGDPVDVVPAVAAEVDAGSVVVTEDFGPYGRRRDAQVAAIMAAHGRELVRVGSPYAVTPGSIRRSNGHAYSVFTPFWKRWNAVAVDAPARSAGIRWRGRPAVRSDDLPRAPATDCDLPPASRATAHALLDRFVGSGALDRYDVDRDVPSATGTSGLSPYLRWGLIHPHEVLAHPEARWDASAAQRFRSELCWRDFYADILFDRPETAWSNARAHMDAMAVDTDRSARDRFARWAAGQTGFPIVDAGMRQLLATGWMHNRVRMITASFLVKDLHLPWQWGARHFLRHLVDGDLASNNHGWQWVAGTGTDAAPYFRIFNPTTQSERYDARGDYIRRWVPELADVPNSQVHAPYGRGNATPGYPMPMVDHAAERHESLRRLSGTRSR
jgi:deoxyribodipyrimidine photo-lyase